MSPAHRAEHEIFRRLVPAVAAMLPVRIRVAVSLRQKGQIAFLNLHQLTVGNLTAGIRIQFIDSIAAGHLHEIETVPFDKRNKKQAEIRIGHKNLIPPERPALAAYNGLLHIQHLLSLADSTDKEHGKPPFAFVHLVISV